MAYETVMQAFNAYRTKSIAEMEARAAEIRSEVQTNPNADITALNIELDGIAQAKENAQSAARQSIESRAAQLITGTSFKQGMAPEPKGDVVASPEYRSGFYKQLLGQQLEVAERNALEQASAERRSDSFSTTTSAAAVIPTQTLDEVISKARKQGGIISVARRFAVPANLVVPIGTPGAVASWNTEGAAVESEEPDVAPINFGSNEILKVFSISASVRRMSVGAFESYLVDELTSSVMGCIANSLVNGTGSGQGTGVIPGITWATTGDNANAIEAAATGVTYGDVVSLMALLKRGYSNNAKFAMNQATLLKRFYSLCDEVKRPIFLQDLQNDGVGRILGHDVILDDFLADDVVIYGDFNYLGYNMVDGIAIERSTESSFKSGRVDYRAMAIADCKPLVDEAFVKLTVASE